MKSMDLEEIVVAEKETEMCDLETSAPAESPGTPEDLDSSSNALMVHAPEKTSSNAVPEPVKQLVLREKTPCT
jgi:hypothetical protein